MNTTSTLLDTIKNSDFYRDYERAFSDATGLPLALRPVESAIPWLAQRELLLRDDGAKECIVCRLFEHAGTPHRVGAGWDRGDALPFRSH